MDVALRNRKHTSSKVRTKRVIQDDESVQHVDDIHEEKQDSSVRQMGDGESNPDQPVQEIFKEKCIPNEPDTKTEIQPPRRSKLFRISFEIDLVSVILFVLGVATRMYKLEEPRHIV